MSGIVSLVPSMTEILYCLGLGSRVVGVTEHCNFPVEAISKAKVGTFAQPELAKIVALKPELVVVDAGLHKSLVERLRSSGVQVLASTPANVQEVLALMSELGQLYGNNVEPIVADFRQRVDKLKSQLDGPKPRVLRLMTTHPFIIPGPTSCQYDALAIAGGLQMEVKEPRPYVEISWEQIVDFDPEIILFCGIAEGQQPPARCKGCSVPNPVCQRTVADIITQDWKTLSAVRYNKVFPLACHTICRPGPRLFAGMEFLREQYFSF